VLGDGLFTDGSLTGTHEVFVGRGLVNWSVRACWGKGLGSASRVGTSSAGKRVVGQDGGQPACSGTGGVGVVLSRSGGLRLNRMGECLRAPTT